MKRLFDSVPAAIVWRYAAHAAMVAIAIWNESRPAAARPDLLLVHIPRVAWIANHNYHFWLLLYVPVAIGLWRADRRAFLHFLWIGGVLSLLRGVCIPLSGLGPVEGPDTNAGISAAMMWRSWVAIVNPVTALFTDAPHVGLTKVMFFSGHVSSTFLLWLYCRGKGALGPLALVAHLAVTASVFLAHLHYTVDVVGAWAITGAVYALAVRAWPLRGRDLEAADEQP
ncbi:MAG: sphingomyelin synthase family protein [Planctomycetes bacterium]|nr:sphingomyelin synthase family protein [Planctomycetota bacterium]